MAKLRHIAMAVPDMDRAATFYEEVFELKRQRQNSYSVMLTDGIVSLVLIDNTKFPLVKGRLGLDHVGFVVDDLDETQDRITARGGRYAEDRQKILTNTPERQAERVPPSLDNVRKCSDIDGLVFDIVSTEYAEKHWGV